jgi:hypothetical protein
MAPSLSRSKRDKTGKRLWVMGYGKQNGIKMEKAGKGLWVPGNGKTLEFHFFIPRNP